MPLHLTILTPVYNDWDCFGQLLIDVDRQIEQMRQIRRDVEISVIVVNDGSIVPIPDPLPHLSELKHLKQVDVLELHCNMGHQRAIAIGLMEIVKHRQCDAVIVMDADGEDRPEDLVKLINEHLNSPDHIIVASRSRRSESFLFRLFYFFYKLIFRTLTAESINFGNFSLIPFHILRHLTLKTEIWNNLAAAILRSRVPFKRVLTDRGRRYSGQSKMNKVSLIIHGLSAVSVFGDITYVRIFLMSIGFAVLTMIGIVTVVSIKLFTGLAIPGWATYTVGILLIIFIQLFILSMSSIIFLLNNQVYKFIIPTIESDTFISNRRTLFHQ